MNLGLLCSNKGRELEAVIEAMTMGRISGSIQIVIADRHSEALSLARLNGFYGVFIPRSPYHANRDGFERRLIEVLTQAEVQLLVLAGYEREPGPVLTQAFPGRLLGLGLESEELVGRLAEEIGPLPLIDRPGRNSAPGDGP